MPNAADGIDVEITTFGGSYLEMEPSDLPDGSCPDSQDVAFRVGSASTRPPFKRLYLAGAFAADVVWQDNYKLGNGTKLNLFLTADGNLWKEDAVNAPGTFVQFGSVPAGSRCKAIAAFGRIYFAFSDGVHGTDHAWQYDGTNFDRVSQDGPASAISVASVALPSSTMSASGTRTDTISAGGTATVAFTVSRAYQRGTLGNISYGFYVNLTANDTSLAVGQSVTIAGNTQAAFNGTFVIALVNSPSLFLIGTTGVVVSPTNYGGSGGTASLPLPNPGITTISPITGGYGAIEAYLTAADLALAVGQTVTITGNANTALNGTYSVQTVAVDFKSFTCAQFFPAFETGGGGTAVFGPSTIVRANNLVTVETGTPHSLQVGYQAQISGVPASQVGGGIVSIVIVNADNPGIATVTTTTPHGLVPTNQINISSVIGTAIGGAIVSAQRAAEVVTVTTTTPHGLQYGSQVAIAGVTDTTYNGQFSVLAVPSDTTFTYGQIDTDSSSAGGTVTTVWPIANNDPALNFFTVETTPSPTTFTLSISYPDGTWTGGTITFGWDGIFYVSGVPTSTTFTYQQYGPNATSNATGTVTPYGQAAPGKHKAVCIFQTRNGFITAPGPEFEFVANGGQYLAFSNVPIGPPNVIKRIIALTGANGERYLYLGVTPQVGTQIIGTSTVLNDNVSTSALFDVGDAALLSGTGIDIEGNNLFAQVTLGPVCGVEFYADRLMFYGEDNRVLSLLNMSFDGGFIQGTTQWLAGWTMSDETKFALPPAPNGTFSLQITPGTLPAIYQSAYQTSTGAPILDPTQTYSFKAKISVTLPTPDTTVSVSAVLSSASMGGIVAEAMLHLPSVTTGWEYYSAPFVGPLPATIPADMVFYIIINGAMDAGNFVSLDEMAMIFAQSPYNENTARVSYVINPEAFDANTAVLGSSQDPSKIQCTFNVRDNLIIVTRDRLHTVKDLAGVEPGGWSVDQVEDNCGAVSLFGLATGKNFGAWASDDGVQLYSGGDVGKITQEMQAVWNAINKNAFTQIVAANDQANRRMHFALPAAIPPVLQPQVGTPYGPFGPRPIVVGPIEFVPPTSPTMLLTMDYRHLDSGADIADAAPVRASLSGKLIAPDLRRKWTRWNGPCLALGFVFQGSNLTLAFSGAGKENTYYSKPVDPTSFLSGDLTDDDYGQIPAYYIVGPFAADEEEQGLQLGRHRHLYAYLAGIVQGVGWTSITPFADSLNNPWPNLTPYKLSAPALHDVERGMQVAATKMFLKIAATPILAPADPTRTPPDPQYTNGLDTYFEITRLCSTMKPHPSSPSRGAV